MIYFPPLNQKQKSMSMLEEFRGYNANVRIADGEFCGMKNMTSDKYPALSPRGRRRRVRAFTKPHGLYMHNELCWVDGTKFYYGGVEKGTVADSDKTLIGMGAYVLIFPDKKYYDSKADTFGSLTNSVTTSGTVTTTLTKVSGDAYTITATQATAPAYHEKDSYWCDTAHNYLYQLGDSVYTRITTYTISATAPAGTAGAYWLDTSATKHVLKKFGTAWAAVLEEFVESATQPVIVKDGSLWIDTSSTPHALKQYSTAFEMWTSIPTTYVKIAAPNIGKGFNEYDGVTISGMANSALNGEFTLYGVGDDYIIITALIDAVATQSTAVSVSRGIPDMDYVTELNNRIWGCSNENHEIYACKLGDPKNWKQFLNVSTDSFAVTVGSRGDFTGAVTQFGSVLFFKENVIHELYGTKPSNFKIEDNNVRGVKAGCSKSLAIVNETLFFMSKQDVCSFGTSVPRQISYALGAEILSDAVGAACGHKYYMSAKDAAGTYRLFVYDFEKDMWHIEDTTHMKFAATAGNDLYFIAADNIMYSVSGAATDYDDADAADESDIEWSAEFGDMGLDSPNKKYISKLQFRMKVKYPALVRISIMYDNSGTWEEVYHANVSKLNSFTANIIPRRCDTMRVKIHGNGEFELYSLAKTVERGSDM